jgi:hypothetical protein
MNIALEGSHLKQPEDLLQAITEFLKKKFTFMN